MEFYWHEEREGSVLFFVFFWNLNKALSVDLIYLGAVFVYAVVFVISFCFILE